MKKNNIHNIPYYLQVLNYSKIIEQNHILKKFYENNYNKITQIIDKHFDGCCAWTEYGWIADGNKFTLDYIKKNSGPDSID